MYCRNFVAKVFPSRQKVNCFQNYFDPRFLKPSRLLLEAQQRSEFGRFRGGATQDQVMPPDSTDKKEGDIL